MGWESVLFLATADVLSALFPKWKPALRPPVTRTEINPFTGKSTTREIDTMDYDDDEDVAQSCDWTRVAALDAPAIGQQVSTSFLDRLARELGVAGRPYQRALSEPPGSETVVMELDETFVAALATATTTRLDALARATCPDLSEEEARSLLSRLVELARDAQAQSAQLYLIEES